MNENLLPTPHDQLPKTKHNPAVRLIRLRGLVNSLPRRLGKVSITGVGSVIAWVNHPITAAQQGCFLQGARSSDLGTRKQD